MRYGIAFLVILSVMTLYQILAQGWAAKRRHEDITDRLDRLEAGSAQVAGDPAA